MAHPQLYSIGEVASLFHLSVSSLRHYEALGLVSPEYVDPSTNYRYYSVRQFEPLNTIRYLRALDMPLTEIADFLQNRDVETIEEKLRAQKAAVGIVEKIIGFLFLIPSSMLSTVSALGAQNIGAGKPERARLTLR